MAFCSSALILYSVEVDMPLQPVNAAKDSIAIVKRIAFLIFKVLLAHRVVNYIAALLTGFQGYPAAPWSITRPCLWVLYLAGEIPILVKSVRRISVRRVLQENSCRCYNDILQML